MPDTTNAYRVIAAKDGGDGDVNHGNPGWWVLVCLRKAGLVTRATLPCTLPPRPGMRMLGTCIAADAGALAPAAGWTATWRAARAILVATPSLRLHAPGVNLAPAALAQWCGPRVACGAGSRYRLELVVDETVVRGLPAVLLGVAARGVAAATFSFMLLPLAMAFEQIRASLAAMEVA